MVALDKNHKPMYCAQVSIFLSQHRDVCSIFEFFRQRRHWGVLFLRLLIGSFIIWGVQDNILSHERMLEFQKFLAARGTPSPEFAAPLSVYAQLICGVSICNTNQTLVLILHQSQQSSHLLDVH